jgi:tetratricopeptide (TPR) repeat protein
VAGERQLNNQLAAINLEIAETDFLRNDYDAARRSLEDLAVRAAGATGVKARILLAGVLTRLGDFGAASQYLEPILADVERGTLVQFAAMAYGAAGELAVDSGRLRDARQHFEKAASLWTDDLPSAASVEARSYIGLLDARTDPAAATKVLASVTHARKIRRLGLEARCRLCLARIHLLRGQHEDAVTVLGDVPPDGDRSIGPELQAQVAYWRGRALAERGDHQAADQERKRATETLKTLQARLPAPYRDRFAARAEIKEVMAGNSVR